MPPRTEWRWKEDGSYISGPKDPDYWKKYFNEKLRDSKFDCIYCGKKQIVKYHKTRHEKTKKCMKAQSLLNKPLYNENCVYSEFD
jgi:hypothetical protein